MPYLHAIMSSVSIRLLTCAFLVSLMAACVGANEDPRPSRGECERLRDHVAGLAVAEVPAATLSSAATRGELSKHQRNVSRALGEDFVAGCQAARTRDEIECALEADSARAAAACEGTERL